MLNLLVFLISLKKSSSLARDEFQHNVSKFVENFLFKLASFLLINKFGLQNFHLNMFKLVQLSEGINLFERL